MPPSPQRRSQILFVLSILMFVFGLLVLAVAFLANALANANAVPEGPVYHTARVIYPDDPALAWSPGWRVTHEGATPPEPVDPLTSPAGTVRFSYQGHLLALTLKPGDYWAYLYATVDGAPANLLPASTGHDPAPNPPAGHLPLYKPDADGWPERVYIHQSSSPTATHEVEITFWRGWAETPLLAITVDDDFPSSEGKGLDAVLAVLAFVLMAPATFAFASYLGRVPARSEPVRRWAQAILKAQGRTFFLAIAIIGFVLAVAGVAIGNALLCWMGLGLLGVASLLQPAYWYAALFFALPFYYSFNLPVPGGAVNLVDVGVWAGLLIVVANTLVVVWSGRSTRAQLSRWALLLLVAIALWAAISTAMSDQVGIALREWRTVFAAAVAVGAGLWLLLRYAADAKVEVAWVVGGWLAGATVFAALGLLLYPNPTVIIPAEGVQRLRGFYGSPNNLALYLERTLAVALAWALFARNARLRIAAAAAALIQLAAFLLTFSKGGLFLALPVMGIALWGAGYFVLRKQGRSTRILWGLAGVAIVAGLAMVPFLGTERFARILDLSSGTGFLRINLWRAAFEMARDHPLLGVGPDGFLYAYRSAYIFPQAWMEPNLNHPHNWLLDWWIRLGIPGLLLGAAFWSVIVWNLLRNLRAAGKLPTWDALQVGLLAAVAAALAHGLIDLSYALPDLMAVWAMIAILSSLSLSQRHPGDESPTPE